MWQSRLLTGNTDADVLVNAEWELVKTPEQWWFDYAIAHPEYDPFSLNEEQAEAIYILPQTVSWGGEEYETLKSENTGETNEENRLRYLFLCSHFGDVFKYRLVLKRYGNRTAYNGRGKSISPDFEDYVKDHFKVHDPIIEKPDAYLHFCRLSHLVDIGWTNKRVMSEVLKFVHKYGPPWYPQFAKAFAPPYNFHPPDFPLTVDAILWESLKMNWAVNAYKLLSDLDEDITAIRKLKSHMSVVLNKQKQVDGLFYYLVIRNSGHAYAELDDSGQLLRAFSSDSGATDYTDSPPPLTTETQIIRAATALVIGLVNEGLNTSAVKFGLTNNFEKAKSIGVWVPEFNFDNLLGAMWMQFYLRILENGRFKECGNENCRRLFPASRSNREYCCKECGVKQYMRDHRKQSQINNA